VKSRDTGEIELIISKSLTIGVLVSAAVTFAGLLLFFITGSGGYPGNSYPTNLLLIFQGLFLLRPYAVILTGLFILILTPVFRVGVSIVLFIKEKDYAFAKITALVFLILLISFMLGRVE
jgi:Predicted membrane protein